MEYLLLGFFTGISLILAIGAQNIFVIEQGLKKQHVFIVCLICSLSDLVLIFLGIFLFHYFNQYFNSSIELILNLFLVLFLLHFIYKKIKSHYSDFYFSTKPNNISKLNIIFKTLGFTYLNPHVYSDTVFFLGNFSKNFPINYKIYFGIGGSIASFLFFYLLGYLANYFSKYLNNVRAWVVIKWIISLIMSLISIYVIFEILKFFN